MLLKIVCAVLLCLRAENAFGRRVDAEEPEYINEINDGDDSYDDIQEDDSEDVDPIRVKRLKSKSPTSTLSPQEVMKVRGAIKEILSGNENLFTPIPSYQKNDKKYMVDKRAVDETASEEPSYDNIKIHVRTKIDETSEQTESTKSETQTETQTESVLAALTKDVTSSTIEGVEDDSYQNEIDKDLISTIVTKMPTRSPLTTTTGFEDENYENEIDKDRISTIASKIPTRSPRPGLNVFNNISGIRTPGDDNTPPDPDPGTGPQNAAEAISAAEAESIRDEQETPITKTSKTKTKKTTEFETAITETTTTKKKTRRTTTKFQLDVPALLEIIANLTYDYEMNLTDNLNETLLKLSVPTCETPTTTEKRIFIDYDANATGTIVAKCFVCGLTEEGVPRHAQCADAFAGDFLPLVPVDMTARGKISKFRKYCRYLDVNHYLVNASMPRSVYGRWTGGCSVRWIDLSGIYTQRTCRNRERAVTGRHYASKRMAKLEMALQKLDNGCISSPMATLVPLSRGISLYARFHACVCTGSWCNRASFSACSPILAVPLLLYFMIS